MAQIKNKVVIFGINDFAQLADYYLTNDSPYEVVAFCVHKQYIPITPVFLGLPVVNIDKIECIYPPDEFCFFAPMSYSNMNKDREYVFNLIKQKRYNMISYVSSKATTFHNEIGENCFILENNVIQPFTTIGDNVILWSGNHIGHHSKICSHVMITSHVVISGHCSVESYSYIGVNSSVRDSITLNKGTMVGMGSNVVKDTIAWHLYMGNPAKLIKSII